MSVLSRGSLQERLQWAFSLYDINGDGIITKDEMLNIVTAIYEMMGRYTEPTIDETTAKEHVERVFQVSKDTRTHACTHTNARTYGHTRTHARTETHTHAHTHTHTHLSLIHI